MIERTTVLLDVERLCVAYRERLVLRDITLRVTAGESVALLGCNGSGKTTLLRAIAGTLAPVSGSIFVGQEELGALSERQRAQRVAALPQQIVFSQDMRVEDFVLLGRYAYLSWWGQYQKRDYALAAAALEDVGASVLRGRRMGELSGGEQQRVALARVLVQETPLVLLDELSAALDVARMTTLFNLLEQRRRMGTTFLMALHDCNLAALYATRLIGLREGRILFDGDVPSVFTEENLFAVYEQPIRVIPHPENGLPQAVLGGTQGPCSSKFPLWFETSQSADGGDCGLKHKPFVGM